MLQWNLQWSREGLDQLSRVQLLKQCYQDKDDIRDECFETDSKEKRLLTVEECEKIDIDPKRPEKNNF